MLFEWKKVLMGLYYSLRKFLFLSLNIWIVVFVIFILRRRVVRYVALYRIYLNDWDFRKCLEK